MKAPKDAGRGGDSLFFEANPNPMFIFAADDLRLLAVNEAMVAKYGWSREELLRMTAADLRPPEERERLRSVIERQRGYRAASGGEWRHCGKDGLCFDVEVTLSSLEYDGREARLVMVNDLTRRKQAETALRQSEEQLRMFIRYAPAAIAMLDLDMRYIAASRRWCEDYGLRGEFIGRSHYDLFPEIPQRWRDLHQRALAGEMLHSEGDVFRRADGSVQWVKWEILPWRGGNGEIGGLLIAAEDITARKLAEADLRRSEQRFRGTFENAAVGMAHVALDGTWLRVNSKLCEIVGYSRDELLHRSFADITHPDDLQNDWHNARRAINGEIDSYSSEKRYIHKDGSIRWISLSVSLARTPEGDPDYFISVMRDIGERKKALKLLADSERRFRAMTEKAAEDVILMAADGTVVYESPNAESLLGYPHGAITGTNGLDLAHPDDRPQAEEILRELVREPGASRQGELRMLARDGTENWVHFYATNLLDDPAVGAVVLNLHNITQRKRAEEERRAAEKRLAAVVAHLTEGLIMSDSGGRLTHWNPAALEMFGYRDDSECLRQSGGFANTFEMRTLEDDRPLSPADWPIARILRGETLREHLLRVRRKDQGWEKIISFSGTLVRNIDGADLPFISTTDVTDAKRAEAAVRAGEERFRTLVSVITDISWTTDAEGRFVTPQDAWSAYTGQSWERHRDFGWFDAVHPDDRETVRNNWRESARTRSLHESEGRLWHAASASYRHFVARAAPLPDCDGTVREWVGSCTDVHERKLAEEQIRRINEELELRVSERTAELAAANQELETFSYSVSHDLRAPLRAIDGFSQILLLDHAEAVGAEGLDYLRRIRAASQRMGELIDALLRLARVTRGEIRFEPVDLSAVARAVADELQAADPERAVEWIIQPALDARGDPRLLRILLENLLGNAWKYTSKQTTARIEFGAEEKDGVRVWFVRDDGAGFDIGQVERLFSPFQRLHKSSDFQGIGIGLATVGRIVSRHGGAIRADGEPGRGAAFHFTLAPDPAGAPS